MSKQRSQTLLENEIFDLPIDLDWKITEAKEDKTGVVDGVNILARIVGPMFVVNGASRNKRFYSEELWSKAIEQAIPVMEAGQMIGTIGHNQVLDDDALAEGKGSHRVSRLWIEEVRDKKTGKMQKVGMGEILVMNTSVGRELNGYVRGGVTFPVSSRAYGDGTNEFVGDAEILDPETYWLECFDFVRVPGVASAIPRLVESDSGSDLQNSNEISESDTLAETDSNQKTSDINPMENQKMNETLEKAISDRLAVEADLDKAVTANKQLEADVAVKANKLEEAEAKIKTIQEEAEQSAAKLEEVSTKLASYEELGSIEDIQSDRSKAEELLSAVEEFGTAEDIKATFEELAQIQEEFGSKEQLEGVFTLAEQYNELGSVAELKQKLETLAQYEELGTVEQVNDTIELAAKLVQENASSSAKALAEEYSVSVEKVEKLLSKMPLDEAAEFLSSVVKRVDEDHSGREVNEESADDAQELNEEQEAPIQTRAGRIFESSVVR